MTDFYENKTLYLRASIRRYLPFGLASRLTARLGPLGSEYEGTRILRNVGRLACFHTQQPFALKYVRFSMQCQDRIRSGSSPSSYVPSHSFSHTHPPTSLLLSYFLSLHLSLCVLGVYTRVLTKGGVWDRQGGGAGCQIELHTLLHWSLIGVQFLAIVHFSKIHASSPFLVVGWRFALFYLYTSLYNRKEE